MTVTTTVDQNGDLIQSEIKPPTYTLSYSRKVPRDGGFGAGEEASIFAQVEVDPDDDADALESKIKSGFAFCKAIVLQQLGVMYGVDEATGVVTGVEVAPPTKTSAGKGAYNKGAKAKTPSVPTGPKTPTDELWASYASSPESWWDNREGKRNPKAPDFKNKQTGEGLWLDSAPEGLFEDDFVGGATI